MVRERFGSNKKEAPDMLGSFIRHGLSQEEAESETVGQMQVQSIKLEFVLLNN
jgi:hypothetical protein